MNGTIDLNVDAGEGARGEKALIPLAARVNVACGFHAGGPALMREVAARARAAGVAVGAHVGYPDPEGFGRRRLSLGLEAVRWLVGAHLDGLVSVCRPVHVKLHGALYHRARTEPAAARAVAEAIRAYDRGLLWIGWPGGADHAAATRAGIPFLAEAFADRAYGPDGGLLPRTRGATAILGSRAAAAQGVEIALRGRVRTPAGWRRIAARTLCCHADHPRALATMRALRRALARAGVRVAAARR